MTDFCRKMNRENLTCANCPKFVTKSRTLKMLHDLSTHEISACTCRGCSTGGSLAFIKRHLEQKKNTCVEKCGAAVPSTSLPPTDKLDAELALLKTCVLLTDAGTVALSKWHDLRKQQANENPTNVGKDLPILNETAYCNSG